MMHRMSCQSSQTVVSHDALHGCHVDDTGLVAPKYLRSWRHLVAEVCTMFLYELWVAAYVVYGFIEGHVVGRPVACILFKQIEPLIVLCVLPCRCNS